MPTAHFVVVFLIAFTGFPEQLIAAGHQVDLLMKTGETLSGELLSVRDSTIVISYFPDATEEELETGVAGIGIVRDDSIRTVTIRGTSYVLPAMGIGLVGGLVAGWAIGSSAKSDNVAEEVFAKPVSTALSAGLGALVGLGAGAIVGAVVSSKDKVISTVAPGNMLPLRRSARYPGEEPDFLRKIP